MKDFFNELLKALVEMLLKLILSREISEEQRKQILEELSRTFQKMVQAFLPVLFVFIILDIHEFFMV